MIARPIIPAMLILASAAAGWALAPEPSPARETLAVQENWELPKTPARNPAKWMAAIDRHKLWGANAPGESTAAAATEKSGWSFTGVVIQGNNIFALIGIGDKPSERYRVGDSTPDGDKILNIEEDGLRLSANGAESVLKIYRK